VNEPKFSLINLGDVAKPIEFAQAENNTLQVGKVLLTQAGLQLAPISGAGPIDGFVDYIRERWKEFGHKTEPSPVGAEPIAQG
jgi:hypothetical protein